MEALSATPDFSLASERLLCEAQKLAPCQVAAAYFIDDSADEALTILFASSIPIREQPGDTVLLSGSWIDQLIRAGLPRIASLTEQGSLFQSGHQQYRDAGIETGIFLPLAAKKGHILGVLALYSRDPGAFDGEVLRQAEAIAGPMALAVESAARHLRAVQQQEFAQALKQASQGIGSGPEANPVLHNICRECFNLFHASSVIVRDAEDRVLDCRLACPPGVLQSSGGVEHLTKGAMVPGASAGVGLKGGAEIISRQADEGPGTVGELSVISVPLKGKDRVIGVLEISRVGTGRTFTGRELEMAEALASLAAAALQTTQLHQETLNTLRQSEAQRWAMVEAVPDAMFRIGRDGTYLDCIAPAEFGLYVPPEKFLGKAISEVMPPDVARQAHEGIDRALATRRVQTLEYQLSTNDEVRDYETRIVANGADDVLAIVRDVTERKELEAQFLQSQKMESLGRLAGGIAHDFNNLLGGILGYASLIKVKVDPSSEAYEFADIIERATERGARLTQQLLTAARKSHFEIRPVDVSEVMQEVVQILSRTLPREITVVDHLRPGLPLVQGDQTQIHQVLMNLCINAADAMPDGGTLTISNREVFLSDGFCQKHPAIRPGQYLQFSVADTGVGISEADQSKIFDPFFTTKDPGKGTGLGLAVVYAIVKNHQGVIEVSSTLGKGSQFTVYLPVHIPTTA